MTKIVPYVRLTKKTIDTETKYTLEVMLPIAGTEKDVTVLENTPLTIETTEQLKYDINYDVRITTSNPFSATEYVLTTIPLSPETEPLTHKLISNVIVVRVAPPGTKKEQFGKSYTPETDGKTIIQFEDAVDLSI